MIGDEWRHTARLCGTIAASVGARDIDDASFTPYHHAAMEQTDEEIIAALDVLDSLWGPTAR